MDIRILKGMPSWQSEFNVYNVDDAAMNAMEDHYFVDASLASLKPGMNVLSDVIDRYTIHLERTEENNFFFFQTKFCIEGLDHVKDEDEDDGLVDTIKFDWAKFYVDFSSTKELSRADKKFNDFTYLFFPVHSFGHYILLIFNIETWELLVLDPSMADEDLCKEAAYFVMNAVKQIMYIRDPPRLQENQVATIFMAENIPKEVEGCNSGILICLYMNAFVKNYDLAKIKWSEEDSNNLRYKIVEVLAE